MTYADVSTDNRTVLTYHRITEAFKFAYAYRALLGDQDFANVTEVRVNLELPSVVLSISTIYPFHSQEWSISSFPCSLTRNITSQYEELGFS